jgi:hypothetical protein
VQMSGEIFSLADIFTKEELQTLDFCDFSPENIVEKFLKHPAVKDARYEKGEGKFYITFTDKEVLDFKIFLAPEQVRA